MAEPFSKSSRAPAYLRAFFRFLRFRLLHVRDYAVCSASAAARHSLLTVAGSVAHVVWRQPWKEYSAMADLERKANLASGKVIPVLPKAFAPGSGKPLPDDIIGARIVRMGTMDADLEGGGLVIDYVPQDGAQICRVVLEFTELGMWVEYSGLVATPDEAQ